MTVPRWPAGGYKEMSSIFDWPIALSCTWAQMRGKGGGGVAGSQPMSTAVQYNGAQINFGDLTPYLIYGGQVFSAQRNLYKPPCPFSWMGNRSGNLFSFSFQFSLEILVLFSATGAVRRPTPFSGIQLFLCIVLIFIYYKWLIWKPKETVRLM